MARKRIYTRVRNETFESVIAFYLATNREWEADAVRFACKRAHIPLNEDKIARESIDIKNNLPKVGGK